MIRVGIIFFGIHSKDYELWNSILYTFRPTPGNSTVNDPIWPKMSDTVSDSKLFGTVRLIILAVRLLGWSERPKSELFSTSRRGFQSTSNIFYLIVLSSYHSLAFFNTSKWPHLTFRWSSNFKNFKTFENFDLRHRLIFLWFFRKWG